MRKELVIGALLFVGLAGCATAPSAPRRPLTAQEAEEGRLDPEVRAVLAGLVQTPPTGPLAPGEIANRVRERWESLAPYVAPKVDAQVRDVRFDSPAGPLVLRTWRTNGGAATLPAVIFIHGGGYIAGTLDLYDSFCRRIALKSRALVIAVDYRRAPEFRFPAAHADVHEAVRYVQAHAAELGVDPSRIALAGDGAGAALAVAEAVELGRAGQGLSAPRALALAYPLADARLVSASWGRLGGRGYLIAPEEVRTALTLYVDGPQLTDPRVSPVLFANTDLRPLPRTLVLVAELDPAIDDGEALANLMRAASVDVTLKREPGMVHGYLLMAGAVEAALRSLDGMGEFLGNALAGK